MDKRIIEQSRDFWDESAEHDKKQLKLSLAIGGMGLGLAGVGVMGILAGAPIEGGLAVALGGGLTATGAESAKSEIQMMLEAKAIAARRGLQAEQAVD
jgi:hypothetical protein